MVPLPAPVNGESTSDQWRSSPSLGTPLKSGVAGSPDRPPLVTRSGGGHVVAPESCGDAGGRSRELGPVDRVGYSAHRGVEPPEIRWRDDVPRLLEPDDSLAGGCLESTREVPDEHPGSLVVETALVKTALEEDDGNLDLSGCPRGGRSARAGARGARADRSSRGRQLVADPIHEAGWSLDLGQAR